MNAQTTTHFHAEGFINDILDGAYAHGRLGETHGMFPALRIDTTPEDIEKMAAESIAEYAASSMLSGKKEYFHLLGVLVLVAKAEMIEYQRGLLDRQNYGEVSA